MFNAKSFLDNLTKNLPAEVGQALSSLGLAGESQRQDQPLKQVNNEAPPEEVTYDSGAQRMGQPLKQVNAEPSSSPLDALGQGLSSVTEKAKDIWQGQSTMGKTAIAGGILGVLFTSGGRKLLGAGSKLGATALIGGLAYRAYQDWQAGKAPVTGPAEIAPPPLNSAFLPGETSAANDLSERLLRAMVAAAKADGHISAQERLRIDKALEQLDIGAEAQAFITTELAAPLDVTKIASLARNEEEAAEIYAATVLVVDEQSPEERGYLDMLASALKLDPALAKHIEARAANIV